MSKSPSETTESMVCDGHLEVPRERVRIEQVPVISDRLPWHRGLGRPHRLLVCWTREESHVQVCEYHRRPRGRSKPEDSNEGALSSPGRMYELLLKW